MTMTEYCIMYHTILRKEFVRVIRIWPQSLLPSAITMVLYFLIFGKIIGSKVGMMGGFDYINFITPGLIIMAVINNAYANVVGSFYGSRFNQSIQELLVSPVSNHVIILGYISGGIARGFVIGIIVSFVAVLFGAFHVHSILLLAGSFIFCGGLFALGGLLNGIFSQSFDDTMIFPTFILTPLIYLGGTFYSLSLLPEPWRAVAYFNPIFYMVDLFRFACLGISTVSPWLSFGAVVLFCAILYSIVLYCLNRGIRLKS
jgi:ABC-2 type transport system permease protein